MTLKDCIEIHEISHRVSVCGITREKIFPFDRLMIEGVEYIVKRIDTLDDGTKSFIANIQGNDIKTWNFDLTKK